MELRYNKKGNERKELVEAVEQFAKMKAVYKRAPGFEYVVDNFIIDKEGNITCKDENALEELAEHLLEQGYEAEATEYGLNIQIGMDGIDGDAISRLESLIESKASLIRKALGADSLMVGESDGKLEFDWFKGGLSPEETKAYMNFVSALVRMAKESKRITAKEKPVENEKYAFRCFLLRLGFIGDEYKTDRKILLKNFTGSSAFKGGAKNEISE
ncbi:MAG: virulence protein [Anaerovoracaceae bacterium]|jgi:hypothetical protein